MRFDPPLIGGRLLRRYKRFLADVRLDDDTEITVHCPNTGAMTGCSSPQSRVWLSISSNPKRKYAHTLEIIEPLELENKAIEEGIEAIRVGINPGKANALVEEAIRADAVTELVAPKELRREVTVPDEAGRFDFGFVDADGVSGFIEVKSVTLCDASGVGAFPDAVSERALRHVRALRRRVECGERGILLFCVQHTGVTRVRCADEIYPEYAQEVSSASAAGVEVVAYSCSVSASQISVSHALPMFL